MEKRTFTADGFTFARVRKNTARRAYAVGLSVVVCPVNLRPFTPWHTEFIINKRDREQFISSLDVDAAKNDFNNLINSIEYYNCKNAETGKYCAYYLPIVTYPGGVCYDYNYVNRG